MTNETYQQKFDEALGGLKNQAHEVDTTGFEHHVWTEIAIRDGRRGANSPAGLFGLRWGLPLPVVVACASLSVLLGTVFALEQAAAYDEEISLAMEAQYVQSIHPVMMSSSLSPATP